MGDENQEEMNDGALVTTIAKSIGQCSEDLQAQSIIVHLFAILRVQRHASFNDGLSFNESGKAFMDG